jgi:hypothetical protein
VAGGRETGGNAERLRNGSECSGALTGYKRDISG